MLHLSSCCIPELLLYFWAPAVHLGSCCTYFWAPTVLPELLLCVLLSSFGTPELLWYSWAPVVHLNFCSTPEHCVAGAPVVHPSVVHLSSCCTPELLLYNLNSCSPPEPLMYSWASAVHLSSCCTPELLLYTSAPAVHLCSCCTPELLLYTWTPFVLLSMVLQELHTEEDRVVTLECVSRGGKPPAEVSKLFSPSTRLASSLVRAPNSWLEGGYESNPRRQRQNLERQLTT